MGSTPPLLYLSDDEVYSEELSSAEASSLSNSTGSPQSPVVYANLHPMAYSLGAPYAPNVRAIIQITSTSLNIICSSFTVLAV
jgi:hypothetical protein